MKKYQSLLLFVLLHAFGFSQIKTSNLKSGSLLNESIKYYKDSVSPATYVLPNNAFTLFYRFNEPKGKQDNYDSVYAVVNHIYRLNRYFGPRRKPSRLTCVIFVKRVDSEALALKNKISNWTSKIGDSLVKTERAGFNFNRPWQFLFISTQEIKPLSTQQIDPDQRTPSILDAGKLSVIAADGTLLETSSIKGFKFNGRKGSVKGKLLTEKGGKKVPVPNVLVSLLRMGSSERDSALTDAYGDFELGVPDENTEYNIVVKTDNQELENIILANQSGQEISRLQKTKSGFEYKLISSEIVKLTQMEEHEDISLMFKKFEISQNTDLKVTENILYALAQYKIEEDSKATLNKVVTILKENPKVSLEVISHTDAQGEDKSNQILSEKRSRSVIDYFISKGIDKNRLKAIGKGETELRNRCTNGVDCSDLEHEYNRRTEFKFSKT